MENKGQNSYKVALMAIVSVFFFWGFVAASNGVLIPVLKKSFDLTQFQSQLVDTAFYIAYFVGSLIYFIWSFKFSDPFNKYGIKKGLVGGIAMSAIGAMLFVPAINSGQYMFFLVGLFVIAFGFAVLQIVANPYVINLGDPAKGSHRLNFAGSINSLGTTVGPVIIGYALFGSSEATAVVDTIDLEKLKLPFIILSIILLLVGVLLYLIKLPEPKLEETKESSIGAFKYPQLVWGMIAIFVYVGVEVSIGSNLGELLSKKNIKGIEVDKVAKFVSLYWGSLMIGRWTGSLGVFNLSKNSLNFWKVIIPFIAFGVVLFFNSLREGNVSELYIYSAWIIVFIISSFVSNDKPARTMMIYGTIAAIMMLIGMFTSGDVALYSIISGGLFCSVMWPCIFNLSIAGLGKYTNQGSSLLVSMILGGALIPLVQGYLADIPSIGIQYSYIVAVVCFLFLAFFGYYVAKLLKSQGINYG